MFLLVAGHEGSGEVDRGCGRGRAAAALLWPAGGPICHTCTCSHAARGIQIRVQVRAPKQPDKLAGSPLPPPCPSLYPLPPSRITGRQSTPPGHSVGPLDHFQTARCCGGAGVRPAGAAGTSRRKHRGWACAVGTRRAMVLWC